jgi:excisionase family DNA binding protein
VAPKLNSLQLAATNFLFNEAKNATIRPCSDDHGAKKVSIHSTGLSDDERLVASPRRTAVLLDCGITRVYELINAGELDSYRDGSSRKITIASIKAYVERQLERAQAA